jgi:hypothetical protein
LIELQHINVKLFLRDAEGVDIGPLVPIFHGWIQEQIGDELLIDVADYRHVPDGPGVMVIGHEADYSVDNTDGRLGVRYARKATLNSNNQERLKQAARSALTAYQRLEEEAKLNDWLRFNGEDIEVVINDRLLAPNRAETRIVLEPEFRSFGDKLFGTGNYHLTWQTEPRRLLGATFHANRTFTAAELLKNLNS